jgi:hypothetical protein
MKKQACQTATPGLAAATAAAGMLVSLTRFGFINLDEIYDTQIPPQHHSEEF